MPKPDYKKLLDEVRSCTLCVAHLPMGANPVLQVHPKARILVVGQAPGIKVHRSGIPFDDQSGIRLRDWMGIDSSVFYDPMKIAILPMGFCYPGTGKSGDLPPRKECADTWREKLLSMLTDIDLALIIGNYSINWHMKDLKKKNLTETVKEWKKHISNGVLPLPHPSPRNNIWLKKNPWFEKEVIPQLRLEISSILK